MNELLDLAKKLDGEYSPGCKYVIVKAQTTADGWQLEIKRVNEEAENESDKQA